MRSCGGGRGRLRGGRRTLRLRSLRFFRGVWFFLGGLGGSPPLGCGRGAFLDAGRLRTGLGRGLRCDRDGLLLDLLLARGLARGRGHLQGGLWGWPCLREGNRPAAPGWSLLLWKKRGRMAHGLRGHRWHGPQWPARPAPKAALRRRYREGLADIRAADRAVVGSGRVVASRSACERRHSGGEIGHAAAEFCKLRQGLFENGIVVRHSPTIGQPSPCRKFSVADDASRQRQAQPDDKVMAFSMIPRWL